MKRFIIYTFTVVFALLAQSATQTDWSGGPGFVGPVTDWGNTFYTASSIDWSGSAGELNLVVVVTPEKHLVDSSFTGARWVYTADIDSDGHLDVLGTCWDADEVTWWQNRGGSGMIWTKHIIATNFDDGSCVYADDIDADGDIDVLGAARISDQITWWENVNGWGTVWAEHLVDGNFDGAHSVYADDIDADGDLDIAGAGVFSNIIAWWENTDSVGIVWTRHIIDGSFDGALAVYTEDMDHDDDMDVLGAAGGANEIAWWENIDGSGLNWIKHVIDSYCDGAHTVYSADFDGDGDFDVLGAAGDVGEISWCENVDGHGISWIEHMITDTFGGAVAAYPTDINGDGDADVAGVDRVAGVIKWWENSDGSGINWNEHLIDNNFPGATSAYAVDINEDGNPDVLGAAWTCNHIAWWNLPGDNVGQLISSILDTRTSPFWGTIDWFAQQPGGSSVKFLVRSSNDPGNMGSWSDTIAAPCSLGSYLTNGDRYVQYAVILETTKPDSVPVLEDVTITWSAAGISSEKSMLENIMLYPITPNPTSNQMTINFTIPKKSHVVLQIFDITGRVVKTLENADLPSGKHRVVFNVTHLPCGVYYCHIQCGEFSDIKRCVILK